MGFPTPWTCATGRAGYDDTQPVEYEPEGTNDGPYKVNCKYANGVKLIIRDNGWNGALETGSCSYRIEGDKGWVETGDATKIECSDNIKPLLRPTESARLALENHVKELVRCIRTRETPSASAAAAANSHVTCHAAFIAFQLGKTLKWDPAKAEFTNDDTANRMRSRAPARNRGGSEQRRLDMQRTTPKPVPAKKPPKPKPPQDFQEGNIATMDAAGLVRILTDSGSSEFQKAKACMRAGELGATEAVPALAALLDDEHLSVYARYGLEPIDDPSAGEALRAALSKLEGDRLIGVVNSLGKRRDEKASAALAKMLNGSDADLARAAAAALGSIGGMSSLKLLQAALAKTSGMTRMAVADASLICAERLLEGRPA